MLKNIFYLTFNQGANYLLPLLSVPILIRRIGYDGFGVVAMGAAVFMHEKIEDFDRARKFAIECAKNKWVFLLDADEMVPSELVRD